MPVFGLAAPKFQTASRVRISNPKRILEALSLYRSLLRHVQRNMNQDRTACKAICDRIRSEFRRRKRERDPRRINNNIHMAQHALAELYHLTESNRSGNDAFDVRSVDIDDVVRRVKQKKRE